MFNSFAGVLAIPLIAAALAGEPETDTDTLTQDYDTQVQAGSDMETGTGQDDGTLTDGTGQGTATQDAREDTTTDFTYSGPVDIYNGAPIRDSEEGGSQSSQAIVNLADGGRYNREDHTFNYSVPGQSLSVHSSVANNIITTDMVSITADEGLDIVLYKKSKPQTDMDLANITDPGKYTLVSKDKENDYQIMSFTIVTKDTGAIDSYKLPAGFAVTNIIHNDKSIQNQDTRNIDLTSEGSYHIYYRCIATDVSYELMLNIDHTAPAFKLKGVKKGKARGPVTITGVGEDETVSLTSGGQEVHIGDDLTVRNVGRYKVTVTDPAGNSKTESFTIRMYLNYQGVIFFLLSVAIIGATVGYMVFSRKRLRIR